MSTVALIIFLISGAIVSAMSKPNRKAIVTDEHRAEAAALRKIWDAAKQAGAVSSQGAFGAAYDIGNQNAVSQFLNANTPLSLKAARGFAAGLKCQIADFSLRLAKEADANAQFATPLNDEFLPIFQVNSQVYGGSGAAPDHEEVIGQLKFRADFLHECGVTQQNGRIVKVNGNSMYPRIPNGAVVLIKESEKEPVAGKYFAISHPAHGAIIKRLRFEDGLWYGDSENPDHDPIPMKEESAKIIGRAVWVGAKL